VAVSIVVQLLWTMRIFLSRGQIGELTLSSGLILNRIISSHILSELAELCDTVGILEKGQLLFSGSQEELKRKTATGSVVEVKVGERLEEAAKLLGLHPLVEEVVMHEDHMHLTLSPEAEDHGFIAEQLVGNGYRLVALHEEEAKLEDIFMKVTKGIVS